MTKAAKKKKVVEQLMPPEIPETPKVVETVFTGGMAVIKWVSEALAAKDIGPAMTHYVVRGREIRATNGKLTASQPWPDDSEFLVSGPEFEKVLARMEGEEPTIAVDAAAQTVTVRSGRFQATIGTLPVDTWTYPGVEDAEWLDVPDGFIDVVKSLRAFVPDNPAQEWTGCIAIDHGNMYATNNIAVAGMACDVGDVQALLPSRAVDFLLRRTEGLESWAWTASYVAFRWSSGAWMRSQLVIGKFPERAAELVRDAYGLEPTQEITDDFREAFGHVAGLAEDTIRIYGDRMESKFKRSVVVAPCECEVPADYEEDVSAPERDRIIAKYTDGKRSMKKVIEMITADPEYEQYFFNPDGVMRKRTPVCSIWGAQFLAPVISQATHWQPSAWPKPAPFRGENVAGFIVGRKGE